MTELQVWLYSLSSVFLISIVSFVGLLTLSIKKDSLKKYLIFMVSFSAGALLGDTFFHLLPEAVENTGFSFAVSLSIMLGIAVFFILEKFIHWHHFHEPHTEKQAHPFSIMNLIGDGVHNFLDGIIIAVSYVVAIPVGIATTVAVLLHEIPQEISDFGVLLQGGFSKSRALFFNFLSALMAVVGALIVLFISSQATNITLYLIPFAAGGFIYIASADLIPELHKEIEVKNSLIQISVFLLGVLVMMALLYIE